ncbi:MAG TPA: MFS transporter [Thermomicrobiales bacterium]|nr:MFS transporter [Thermomicrobiales bacterium]
MAAIQGTIGLFFTPAEGALLPRLVGEDHLVTANALNALNDNIGMLVGPVAGALLYAKVGIDGVALADAATYLVSAGLIALIRTDARPERDDLAVGGSAVARVARPLRGGFGAIPGEPRPPPLASAAP